MAKERSSDKPVSQSDEDFVELKWESNALLMQANRNKVRYLVESDSLKSLVMFNDNHEKPSTEIKTGAANSMKIVNFPHLARLAAQFDLTRQGNGVAIGSLDRCREIRSNKRVSEEVGNREISDKKMKMKIDEEENINVENINDVPADEHSQIIAGENKADSNNANSGCSSEDEHGKMGDDASITVDNKRSRNAHHDQRKRKDKMKKKILALQELLPGCNKVVDKASVLDEAIEYVKTLQHQLQVMSIPHLFRPTPMMIPSVTSQLMMPTLNQFSPQLASTGMGLGMGSGFGLGPVPIGAQVSGMPGFAPMPCVMPYGPGVGELGAGTNLVERWRATSFDHHHQQLGSSFVPPLSSYNDSSRSEDFCEDVGLLPKPKDK